MWKQITPKHETKAYRLNDEPETIHVITVRENEYIVVHVTGYDKQEEKVEFHTDKSLLEKYGIILNLKFKTYSDVVLFDFDNKHTKENILEHINKLNEESEKLGALFGECFTSMNIPFDLYLDNVTHTISNLDIKDDKIIGDIKILDTDEGEHLQKVIDTVGIENMLIKPRLIYNTKSSKRNAEIIKILTFDFYNL